MKKDYSAYSEFVKKHIGLSKNEMIKSWNAEQRLDNKPGISRHKGFEIIRETLGEKLDQTKYESGRHGGRPRTKTDIEITEPHKKRGIEYIPPDEAQKVYLRRYNYVCSYHVRKGTMKDIEYITLGSRNELTKGEVIAKAREILESEQNRNNARYAFKIYFSTIKVEFGIADLRNDFEKDIQREQQAEHRKRNKK